LRLAGGNLQFTNPPTGRVKSYGIRTSEAEPMTTPAVAPVDPFAAVADPQLIRQMIGEKSADLDTLRRLYRLAVSRQRKLALLSIRPPVARPIPQSVEVASRA